MPLADFVCNSPKCRRKDGSAPVFELPTKAVSCPYGHKRIVRLFNKVNVRIGRARPDNGDMRHTSSGFAARVDQLAEPAMLDAERRKRKGIDAGRRWKSDNGMVRTVPMQNLGGALQQVYAAGGQQGLAPGGLPLTKAEPGGKLQETIEERLQQPIPQIIEARDTEHRLVRRNGKIEIEKQ